MQNCKQCQTQFELSDHEKQFLEKVSPVIAGVKHLIPEPTLCSVCRRQRRYSFRNDWNLYKRNCSKTGKPILSVFPADVKFPVYSQDAWWSDEFEARDYGRDYDFSRPFFDQFAELQNVVPRISSVVINCENSEYTVFAMDSRNCYLCARMVGSEDVYYSYLVIRCRDTFDSYGVTECELCYECMDAKNCYSCIYTNTSASSNDLMFCKDMKSCKYCFGCIGLVQKQYCFFNEQLSKEEYEKRVAEWMDGSVESINKALKGLEELSSKLPARATIVYNSENVSGSYIFDSRNVHVSYDIMGCEDIMHCTQTEHSQDVMDADYAYKGELLYEELSCASSMKSSFCFGLYSGASEVLYSMECHSSQNLFGCISMNKNKYCILNKQYTKEEYEELVPRIIEHMKSTGEWGEFFPATLSAFPYNRTAAMDYTPLSEEEVRVRGLIWEEKPEDLVDVNPENVSICTESGRPFRLSAKELEFYKKMNLPAPTLHPDVRHKNRLSSRNPYRLRNAHCGKCQKSILTDEQSDRVIYCESCYLSEIY